MSHSRNVYFAEALAQVQRKCASSNKMVSGFARFENIIQLDVENETSTSDSLLEVRNGVLYVTAINEPLEHMSASCRFALDETPIVPDSPRLKTYTTGNRVPLSQGRASIWTLLPVLCGNRSILATLLLQRCQSVSVDAATFSATNDLCIAATENAQQTDDMWLEFANVWLPLCGTSFKNPEFVYIDGHSSHVTRSFIQLAATHGLYVIIEPSHTSMILQVADVGINRLLKLQYSKEYTAILCAYSVLQKTFDDTERLGCVVRTVVALKEERNLIVDCFRKCGLLSGYRDLSVHFPVSTFNSGIPLRDINLPQVNTAYIKHYKHYKGSAVIQTRYRA